jgi:transmembrane 9 superfamily protein 2/4
MIYRVHGDVFRPPRGKNVLAALIGSGVQLFMMSFIIICLCFNKKTFF